MPKQKILDFQSNSAPDRQGRFLRDLQSWPDHRLEHVHDCIQWMFPLREPSGFNPSAPVLDDETIATIRARPDLQASLRLSFERMLRFYGLEMHDGTVVRAGNFAERARNWLRPYNHNHLRITRILKCLMLAGLEAEASAFFECLTGIHASSDRISEETFDYWRDAVGK